MSEKLNLSRSEKEDIEKNYKETLALLKKLEVNQLSFQKQIEAEKEVQIRNLEIEIAE